MGPMLIVLLTTLASALPTHVITRMQKLHPMTEFRSVNGVLDVHLVVDVMQLQQIKYHPNYNVSGTATNITWKTRAYNGLFPGPTLIVKPGDRINMRLTNNLIGTGQVGEANTFHDLNYTNMHTHGLHISPYQDDVLNVTVPPQSSVDLVYDIVHDHSPGLFWYHVRSGAVVATSTM